MQYEYSRTGPLISAVCGAVLSSLLVYRPWLWDSQLRSSPVWVGGLVWRRGRVLWWLSVRRCPAQTWNMSANPHPLERWHISADRRLPEYDGQTEPWWDFRTRSWWLGKKPEDHQGSSARPSLGRSYKPNPHPVQQQRHLWQKKALHHYNDLHTIKFDWTAT